MASNRCQQIWWRDDKFRGAIRGGGGGIERDISELSTHSTTAGCGRGGLAVRSGGIERGPPTALGLLRLSQRADLERFLAWLRPAILGVRSTDRVGCHVHSEVPVTRWKPEEVDAVSCGWISAKISRTLFSGSEKYNVRWVKS